jgi:tetratricopeptide (TPR) repeat protein
MENELESEYRFLMAKENNPNFIKDANFAIDLNNLGLQYRKIGRLDRAELLVRKALQIDIDLSDNGNQKIPHRLNNLSSILIMQGKNDEAKLNLSKAWEKKKRKHDITSIRILFVRLTLAILENGQIDVYIGQLKTLFSMASLPDYANVVPTWDNEYFIRHLRPGLSHESADFLSTLSEVTNDTGLIYNLEKYNIWTNQKEMSLEEPWH